MVGDLFVVGAASFTWFSVWANYLLLWIICLMNWQQYINQQQWIANANQCLNSFLVQSMLWYYNRFLQVMWMPVKVHWWVMYCISWELYLNVRCTGKTWNNVKVHLTYPFLAQSDTMLWSSQRNKLIKKSLFFKLNFVFNVHVLYIEVFSMPLKVESMNFTRGSSSVE